MKLSLKLLCRRYSSFLTKGKKGKLVSKGNGLHGITGYRNSQVHERKSEPFRGNLPDLYYCVSLQLPEEVIGLDKIFAAKTFRKEVIYALESHRICGLGRSLKW